MKVFFSGLCAFAGWRGDGPTQDPVRIILPKTGADAESPHQPMISIASHSIKKAKRLGPAPLEDPTFGDFAFVGPGGVEFLSWHLGPRLALPDNAPGPLILDGTEFIVDLARLCVHGGGGLDLDPTDAHVATSLTVTSGTLKAELTCSENPEWFFIGDDANGKREKIGIDEDKDLISIKIADRITYTIDTEGAGSQHVIRFDALNPSRVIELSVFHAAEIWITNLSRLAQPCREKPTKEENDRLEDVRVHYNLFTNPPAPKRRYVPVLKGDAPTAEDSICCVKESVRI